MVIETWELEVARWQYAEGKSIFSCNSWSVFSDGSRDHALSLGKTHDGKNISTFPIPGAPAVWGQKWNMRIMFNTNVLLRAWDHVIQVGTAAFYGWTVKVDPDSVFFPERLITHLRSIDNPHDDPPSGKKMINCAQYHSIQGPLEVISRRALLTFAAKKSRCSQQLDLRHLPEDTFLSRCLRILGAKELWGVAALQDANCGSWVDCSAPNFAVYHPLKGLPKYRSCMAQAGSK